MTDGREPMGVARIEAAETLSDLMELAIADIGKTVRRRRVAAHMGYWGGRNGGLRSEPLCTVCLAGSMMLEAGIKPGAPERLQRDGGISPATFRKLLAVDHCRQGDLAEGLMYADAKKPEKATMKSLLEKLLDPRNMFLEQYRALSLGEVETGAAYWNREMIPAMRKAGI